MNARTSWYIVAPFAIAVVIAAALLHCIAPLPAVAVAAGIAVAKRQAILITLGTWLVTQIYGFGFLHYSHSLATLVAALSLALGAIAATLIASAIARGKIGFSSVIAFLAGFVGYQIVTYAFSLFAGGSDLYSIQIMAQIFAVNVTFFIPLLAIVFIASYWETAKHPARS